MAQTRGGKQHGWGPTQRPTAHAVRDERGIFGLCDPAGKGRQPLGVNGWRVTGREGLLASQRCHRRSASHKCGGMLTTQQARENGGGGTGRGPRGGVSQPGKNSANSMMPQLLCQCAVVQSTETVSRNIY